MAFISGLGPLANLAKKILDIVAPESGEARGRRRLRSEKYWMKFKKKVAKAKEKSKNK